MRAGSRQRDAAKAAGVPVYGVKNGEPLHLLRALETLLGLQPSAGSIFDSGSSSDEEPVQYQNHVVSLVRRARCTAAAGGAVTDQNWPLG